MTCAVAFMLAAQAKAFFSPRQETKHPASQQEQPLSISNGKLSATFSGDISAEEIFLSDTTIPDKVQNSPFAVLRIDDPNSNPTKHFHRSLSVDSGLVSESYQKGSTRFHREYFSSRQDHLLAMRLSADKAQALSFSVSLSAFGPHKAKARGQQITMTGHLTPYKDSILHFCSILKANTPDGKIFATDSTLFIDGATDVVLYYVNESSLNDEFPYIEKAADDAWHTVNYTYEQFRERHLADIRKASKLSDKKNRPQESNFRP